MTYTPKVSRNLEQATRAEVGDTAFDLTGHILARISNPTALSYAAFQLSTTLALGILMEMIKVTVAELPPHRCIHMCGYDNKAEHPSCYRCDDDYGEGSRDSTVDARITSADTSVWTCATHLTETLRETLAETKQEFVVVEWFTGPETNEEVE